MSPGSKPCSSGGGSSAAEPNRRAQTEPPRADVPGEVKQSTMLRKKRPRDEGSAKDPDNAGTHATPGRRVLIECTYTHLYGGNTGIQRAVRNICSISGEVGAKLGIECLPVIHHHRGFRPIRNVARRPLGARLLEELIPLRIYLRRGYFLLAALLAAIFPYPAASRFLFAPTRQFGLMAILKTALKVPLFPLLLTYLKKPPRARPGDVLILLDSSWHLNIWSAVAEARKDGAHVVAAIYDLIPLTHPHFCVPEHVQSFTAWMQEACGHADSFIAISDTVRRELTRYLKSNPSLRHAADKRSDYFHLGANVDHSKPVGKVRRAVQEAFSGTDAPSTYLTVGTIEPRKNHSYLLDAFDRIWQRRPDVRLCIVGGKGWSCEDIWHRIQNHPGLGKRLFMFNNLSDAELAYCYSRARALIFPSRVEGFGLPLVEALYHRLNVLASDIPAFREIAAEHCVFFDIQSPDSLVKIVLDFEATGRLPLPKNPETFTWPDWRETCESLLTKALALSKG